MQIYELFVRANESVRHIGVSVKRGSTLLKKNTKVLFFSYSRQVTRYQSDPGQATTYMIGQLQIKKARKYSKDSLGDKFSLRDFHYQVNLFSLALYCCCGCYKLERWGNKGELQLGV